MHFTEMTAAVRDPEGPVWMADGGWLVTEMATGRILWLTSTGARVVATTGRPNGLAVDGDGVIWVAESLHPSLLTLDPITCTVTEILSEAHSLKWPNDLCFLGDGSLLLTDSGTSVEVFEKAVLSGDLLDLDIDGRILRFDPTTAELDVLDSGLRFANGIAVHPDEGAVFVTETLTGNIYRYGVEGSRWGERELFTNVLDGVSGEPAPGVAGPDGMAFSSDGSLFVAVLGYGTVSVVDPGGSITFRWQLDDTFPTNVAFGGGDLRTLLVTGAGTGRLLTTRVDTAGAPLPAPKAWSQYLLTFG